MYESRRLGDASLTLFRPLASQISFSDFCVPSGTIEFKVGGGFLRNAICLFQLSFPGFELEAKVGEGRVWIRRNGDFQCSDQFLGDEELFVVIQWDSASLGCQVFPIDVFGQSLTVTSVRTMVTVPPISLVRTLRTSNLLFNEAYLSGNDAFASVLDCLHLCEADIRRHGGESFIWTRSESGCKPLSEPEISLFVAGYLSSHGAARNFEVCCEPVAGTGKVDFYVLAPVVKQGMAKIAIEAKKAESPKLVHGLSTQLPEYMRRLGAGHGIYLTYWLKSASYMYPSQVNYAVLEAEKLHPVQRSSFVRTIGLDLSLGPSPSKL